MYARPKSGLEQELAITVVESQVQEQYRAMTLNAKADGIWDSH